MRALLDTSIFVAREAGRPMGTIPEFERTEVSVITLGELTAGVLAASDDQRPMRLATLTYAEASWEPLPVDAEVARRFGEVMADLRRRGRKLPVLDALIAATALVEGIPVVTQDRDYEAIDRLTVIRL
jgi:predicted nucleic acid-binding protein